MPCVIRKQAGEKREVFAEIAGEEWKLAEQFNALELWLQQNAKSLDSNFHWIADIGFGHRPEAASGGPVISLELMKTCIDCNLVIFLSEYACEAK